ncbi:fimbrial protein [Chromobacterium haemolyticum]|uniref:Fimbrial protein n=1 Tax=Chromobacterium haemolyticum TaxID=394935 RepID=A0A1W0CAA1_9NEIS|nr:fimbrial protein [Chromobacterium haemolyticum]OQS31665.1 hypothetical protein B0T45_22645 [Chromobacterium haemolyticum]
MKSLCFLFALLLFGCSGLLKAESIKVIQSTMNIDAHLVASTCHLVVDADGVGNSMLSLGVYNKGLGVVGGSRYFNIRAFEDGSTQSGCSAFMVAPTANIRFGGPGQLDEEGVITRGAGDQLRIEVRALDKEASYQGAVNSSNFDIDYPNDFAAKGMFRFQVDVKNLERASAGEYNGSLAFIVSYL